MVFDYTGKKISELSAQQFHQRFIDVSGFSEGMYVVRFIFDSGHGTTWLARKIIIKH